MLTELRLENFKCFGNEVVIPTSSITLLTGINAKGKSTTLHALLMLHQSIDHAFAGAGFLNRIDLNGRYVHLGTFREIQNRSRPKGDAVKVGLEFSDSSGTISLTRLLLEQTDDEARWANIAQLDVERFGSADESEELTRKPAEGESSVLLDLSRDRAAHLSGLDQLVRMYYVGADRLGPQDFYPRSDEGSFRSVGVRGESTAEVLFQSERMQQTVDETDPRRQAEGETLLVSDQVSAWISYIFDGGKIRVVAPHSTILTIEMNADGSAHYHRPANVGFGFSYALPIVVAGLVAQRGEMVIVENPEAHLHPLAQSRLGEFLAKVSAAGVQVFVESHSEHILNALRLAVKSRWIDENALTVLYFRRHQAEPIIRIEVEADGRIPHWPEGFFDQRTHDFFRLFGST